MGGVRTDGGDEADFGDSLVKDVAAHLVVPAGEAWQGPLPPEDRYQVGELLGSGGMATVHRATDRVLSRTVALKFLRHENPLTVARFQREARAQASVEHPHVCRVYEVGELGGRPFISMQLIGGPTLEAAAAEMSCEQKARVVQKVALGVQAAHDAGLVHRDLKPSNVLLERKADGELEPYVTDFGLAREVGRAELTMTGQVLGTPHYMAPEQALGRSAALDARTDVYALGATLYSLLGGEPPFVAETPSELPRSLADREPLPLRGVPAALERIALRCLSWEPRDRYPTARALADDLDRYLAGQPVDARRPGPVARLRRAARRHPAVTTAALAAPLALAAGLVVAGRRPPPRAWRPAIRELGPTFDEAGDGVAFSRDGSRIAYNADRDGIQRVYLASASGEDPRAVTPADRWAVLPRFTRDGRGILCRMEGGMVRVDVAGGAPREIAPGARYLEECGERTVVAYPHALEVREADGTSRARLRFDDHEAPEAPACDREGRRVVYALRRTGTVDSRASIWMLDLEAGDRIELVPATASNQQPTFHPDGRSVLYSSSRGGATNLWELRLGASAGAVQVTRGDGPDEWPAISPDGSSLVFNVTPERTRLFSLPADGGQPRPLDASPGDVQFIDVSPDGRALVLEVRRGDEGVVAVVSVADGSETVLGAGRMPVWTRDGAEVVWLDGPSKRLVAAPGAGGAVRTVAEVELPVRRLVTSDDGRVYFHRAEHRDVQSVPLAGGVPTQVEGPEPGTALIPTSASIRAVWAAGPRLSLLLPGESLHDPGVWMLPPGARHYGYFEGGVVWSIRGELHRTDLAARRDLSVVRLPAAASSGYRVAAVAPDGTVYYSALERRVQRKVMTNFGER